MHPFTQKPIARGIQSVRAETNPSDVAATLAAAFGAFKEKHQTELDELRTAVDSHSVLMAAQQMNGNGRALAQADQMPVHATRGLRAGQFAAHYGKRAQAAGEDNTMNIADFMRGVAGMKTTDGVMASLAVGTDSAGGFAVPNVVMPKILDALVGKSAVLAAGAGILPLTEGAKSVTIAGIDTLPVPEWRLELGAVAETGSTFRAVVATPRSLACIVRISRELLADADDVSRAITQAITQAFAKEFDRAALVGNGVAPQPLGIFGMDAVTKTAQAGATFSYADELAAYGALLDADAPAPTAMIAAPRTIVGLGGLVDSTGQPLNAPPLLSGVRPFATTGVPTNLGAGTATSLAFIGDFTTVQYVLRESLSIGLLREAYAKTGEIGFLCHARVDVIVNYPQAINVITGVTSVAAG